MFITIFKSILYFNIIYLNEQPEIIKQPILIYKNNNKKKIISFSIDLKTENNFNKFKNIFLSNSFCINDKICLYEYQTKTENNSTFYIDEGKKSGFVFSENDNIKFDFNDPDKRIFNISFPSNNKHISNLYEIMSQKGFENIAWKIKICLNKIKNPINLKTIVFKYNYLKTKIEKVEKYNSKKNNLIEIEEYPKWVIDCKKNNKKKKKTNRKRSWNWYIFSLLIIVIIIFLIVYYYYYKNN